MNKPKSCCTYGDKCVDATCFVDYLADKYRNSFNLVQQKHQKNDDDDDDEDDFDENKSSLLKLANNNQLNCLLLSNKQNLINFIFDKIKVNSSAFS